MPKTLMLLFCILVAGCHSDSQPIAIEIPREDIPVARPSGPIAERPVIESRTTPPDEKKGRKPANSVPTEAASTAKIAEPEVPKREKSSDPKVMDATRAIKLAEQFVRDNGYTDFVPPDASKLVPESIERSKRKDWVSWRQNTLRPRALGYFHESTRDPSGWTVGFQYVNPSSPGSGRAVTMNAGGTELRMEHKNLRLQSLLPRTDDEESK